MTGAVLETKIQVPRRRRTLVTRTRLTDRLSRGVESPLTLVSAPAGFGKTTLLTEWLATVPTSERSVAWLSLDQRDNDPAVFWTYVVAALSAVAEGANADVLAALQPPDPPTEAGLAALINDLNAASNDITLVLDDYHVIDSRDVHDAMAFLLAHIPSQIHVVIASRTDPPLPLARWRARGDLVEIRAADLRFTPDEAAAYLNGQMGLALTAGEVTALEGRTEGWVAALQLAALSMQGRDDPDDIAGFIASFAGDDRYIVDYLIEEVLQRQPKDVQDFLLQTSILSRLTGALCDAVTGQAGSKATLESLDRGNLFLVPLDDRRHWYRYHHLFGDVLRARLHDEQPEHVPELHRRASHWFEQDGERSEAIRHAMAGEDFARAADLVELSVAALAQGRQDATLRQYLKALPDEVIKVRPVLSVAWAGSLMVRGEVVGVESRLLDAERWLGTAEGMDRGSQNRPAEMVVVDEKLFRALPTSIALYRAGQALVLGDVAGTIEHARRALDLVDDDDHVGHASPASLIGLAYWRSGDLEAAHRWYSDAMASFEKADHHTDVIGSFITLADLRIEQGRLREALATYEMGLRVAAEHPLALRGVADIHVGMSRLFHSRNDLDAARQHLRISNELGERASLPQNARRWHVAMARIHEAEGDLDEALGRLDEAGRLFMDEYAPDVRPISAMRARLWVVQRRSAEALGWARERRLSVHDKLSYLQEFEHITLARLLMAQHAEGDEARAIPDAAVLLDRLLNAAELGDRTGSVIEVLVLQALVHQLRGDVPAALVLVRRALTLAEPEGYVRVFVAEGAPMTSMLKAAANQGIAPTYVRTLLSAGSTAESRPAVQRGLIEPLSERELDVLRLLRGDLDGPEIARELVVSLNTVRTHTKHIYAKLGVTNRRAAVRMADELDLLGRARDRS